MNLNSDETNPNEYPAAPNAILENILTSSTLQDVMIDGAGQIFKEVPVVGILIKSVKFTSELKEAVFAEKIYQFLREFKDVSVEKRTELLKKLNKSNQLQYDAGLVLLDYLEKVDINYKPTFLGKIFRAYLEEKLSIDELLKLMYTLEKSFFLDLKNLIQYANNGKLEKQYSYNTSLLNSELLTDFNIKVPMKNIGDEVLGNMSQDTDFAELTDLGKKFVEICKA